jgi:integrase
LVLYCHRHTFITVAASNETSGPLLQALAGHTDPRTTERYVHLADQTIVSAGLRVSGFLKSSQRSK